jgi:hypothetical protein
MLPVETQELE